MTEGNGVGVLKAPPVSAAGLAADSSTSRSSSLFPAPNQSSCGLQPPPSGGKYGPLAPDPPPAVNLCFKVWFRLKDISLGLSFGSVFWLFADEI